MVSNQSLFYFPPFNNTFAISEDVHSTLLEKELSLLQQFASSSKIKIVQSTRKSGLETK